MNCWLDSFVLMFVGELRFRQVLLILIGDFYCFFSHCLTTVADTNVLLCAQTLMYHYVRRH